MGTRSHLKPVFPLLAGLSGFAFRVFPRQAALQFFDFLLDLLFAVAGRKENVRPGDAPHGRCSSPGRGKIIEPTATGVPSEPDFGSVGWLSGGSE